MITILVASKCCRKKIIKEKSSNKFIDDLFKETNTTNGSKNSSKMRDNFRLFPSKIDSMLGNDLFRCELRI